MARLSPTVRRAAVVVIVLALAGMWVYAFSGAAERDAPDRLDDDAFARYADRVCGVSRAELDELPPATHESPRRELADNVDATAGILGSMVEQLRETQPSAPRDARLVGLWLDDWEIYLGDLRQFADSVRVEGYRPFTETQREGAPISEAMDNFARVNDMPACETP